MRSCKPRVTKSRALIRRFHGEVRLDPDAVLAALANQESLDSVGQTASAHHEQRRSRAIIEASEQMADVLARLSTDQQLFEARSLAVAGVIGHA